MRYQILHVMPEGFVHARALDEVVVSLAGGLAKLGISNKVTYRYANTFDRTIVVGAGFAPEAVLQLPQGSTIIYNLEQVSPESSWFSDAYFEVLKKYEVWDYSPGNIEKLRALGVAGASLCPVGYVAELERFATVEKDIDVVFCGSLNDRRRQVLAELQNRGARVAHLFGIYGAERDSYLARAKVHLNIHFYTAKVFEIVRVSYLLANRCFVISENSPDNGTETALKDGLVICPYDQLVTTCLTYLEDEDARSRIAARGQEIVRGRQQSEFLRPLVNSAS